MIYIGVASYDAKLHHSTVGGLFNVAYAMGKSRVGVCLDVIPHDPFIGHARDLMAHRFLSVKDATDMVMIDADVGFDWQDLDRLLSADGDVVCGVYPYKEEGRGYPVAPWQPVVKEGDRVQVIFGPGGFLRVRRKVIEALAETAPQFQDASGQYMKDIFPGGVRDGYLRGEDVNFFKAANAAGFKCWALEGLNLRHTGDKTFEGPWKLDQTI